MEDRIAAFLRSPQSLGPAAPPAEPDAYQVFPEGELDSAERPENVFGVQVEKWMLQNFQPRAMTVMRLVLDAFKQRLYVGSHSERVGIFLTEVTIGLVKGGLTLAGAESEVWDLRDPPATLLGESPTVPNREVWLQAVDEYLQLCKLRDRLQPSLNAQPGKEVTLKQTIQTAVESTATVNTATVDTATVDDQQQQQLQQGQKPSEITQPEVVVEDSTMADSVECVGEVEECISTHLFIQTFCVLLMSIARWLDPADASVICVSCIPSESSAPPVALLRCVRIMARASGLSVRLLTHKNRAPIVVSSLMAFVSLFERLCPRACGDAQVYMVYLDLQLQTTVTFAKTLGRLAVTDGQTEDVHQITRNCIFAAMVACLSRFACVLRLVGDTTRDSSDTLRPTSGLRPTDPLHPASSPAAKSSSSSSSSSAASDTPTGVTMTDGTNTAASSSLPEPAGPKSKYGQPLEELRVCDSRLNVDIEDVPCVKSGELIAALEYALDLFCVSQSQTDIVELSHSLNLLVSMTETVSVLEPSPLQVAQAVSVCLCWWRYRNPRSCAPICLATSASNIFAGLMRTPFLLLKQALTQAASCPTPRVDHDCHRHGLICCALTVSRLAAHYVDDISSKFLETVHGLNAPLAPWAALQIAAAAAGQLLMGVENVTVKFVYARTVRLIRRLPRDVAGEVCAAAIEYTLNEILPDFRDLPIALWIRLVRQLYPIYAATAPAKTLKYFLDRLTNNPDILFPWAPALQEVALTLRLWSIPTPPQIVKDLIKQVDEIRGPLRREMALKPHKSLELADFAMQELLDSNHPR